MKNLLYEIRYYLAATLMVILLLPDETETGQNTAGHANAKPVSTVLNGPNNSADNSNRPAKNLPQSSRAFFSEKETKKTEAHGEKNTKDLYPKANQY